MEGIKTDVTWVATKPSFKSDQTDQGGKGLEISVYYNNSIRIVLYNYYVLSPCEVTPRSKALGVSTLYHRANDCTT